MTDQSGTQNLSYIRLYIRTRSYYVLVDKIKLVAAAPIIVPVPEAQEAILGLGRYKGELIPYLDFAMDADDFDSGGKQRLGVIVEINDGRLIGALVDGVSEQMRLNDESLGTELEDEYWKILERRDA